MKDMAESTILVIDDTEVNLDLIEAILSDEYHVSTTKDGETGLTIAAAIHPDMILLDVMMPGMDGYEVCESLKKEPKTQDIPVIFITALSSEMNESKGFELGAVDYITKPFKPVIVKNRVRTHLELKRHRDHLAELVRERTRELALTQEVTFESLATLAEYRDPETGGHIRRTQTYIRALAEYLKTHPRFKAYLDDETIDLLYKSAPLHDIGKVGVPDRILLKPGPLTLEEFEEMKKHTIYGRNAIVAAARKIGSTSFLRIAENLIYSHHEKWDGSGYPDGLFGEKIPVAARLMALADVFDALISKRVYKEAYPFSEVRKIIASERGRQFDPDITDAFLAHCDEFEAIALHFGIDN